VTVNIGAQPRDVSFAKDSKATIRKETLISGISHFLVRNTEFLQLKIILQTLKWLKSKQTKV